MKWLACHPRLLAVHVTGLQQACRERSKTAGKPFDKSVFWLQCKQIPRLPQCITRWLAPTCLTPPTVKCLTFRDRVQRGHARGRMPSAFSLYLASVCFFHISEYVFAAVVHPDKLSTQCASSPSVNHRHLRMPPLSPASCFAAINVPTAAQPS